MEIKAKSTSVRISPRKVRLIAKPLRGKNAQKALDSLAVTNKRAAYALTKTLKSAVANATNNAKVAKEGLIIDRIEVTEGTVFKRFHPSTRGRVHPYKKRSSHITIILKEAYGTKS